MRLLLDGEPTTLEELLELNPDLPTEDVEALRALGPAGSYSLGGGASAEFVVSRPGRVEELVRSAGLEPLLILDEVIVPCRVAPGVGMGLLAMLRQHTTDLVFVELWRRNGVDGYAVRLIPSGDVPSFFELLKSAFESVSVELASGSSLDATGKLVGLVRAEGETDVDFRTRIRRLMREGGR